MPSFPIENYPPALAALLAEAPCNVLDAGEPRQEFRQRLEALSVESLLAARPGPADRDRAAACLAGLWLRFDFLDRAHQISQQIDTPEGSCWHGILHRREGDSGNAQYWFRRVGRLAVYPRLAAAARRLAEAQAGARRPEWLLEGAEWDPFRFVELCARSLRRGAPHHDLCRQLQQAEWEALFEHCWGAQVKDGARRPD